MAPGVFVQFETYEHYLNTLPHACKIFVTLSEELMAFKNIVKHLRSIFYEGWKGMRIKHDGEGVILVLGGFDG